ncbi:NACHT domain-containing protein [Streptomyces sp. NPDC059850]|uniref:NACHT domain-containing protein n=1 Tax=Streptomyces sp. NPDC059850 TaxID=3346970 RepID=UPI00364A96B8
MAGGRPRTSGSKPLPELQELADWFKETRRAAGYETTHAFLAAHGSDHRVPHRKAVYEIVGAQRLHELATYERFAQALGQPPQAVAEVFGRARSALEHRELAARRAGAPGRAPTPWSGIPLPEAWLQDLLSGQAAAAERFPYDLLGVRKPPLSHIHIEQDLQPLSENTAEQAPRATGPVPTLAAALSAHDHLFITGGPGAGKTTLGRHLVRQIARFWLREKGAEEPWCREAVVAVRVTATDLRTRRAFHRQLSDAADRAGTLRSAVPPDRFAVRPHGVRWLVVVDGLDEVVSPDERKLILENLAREVRPHGMFRLVITSRPLPQDELRPFQSMPSIGFYTLKGFDPAQQLAFAERWFAAQEVPDADAEARSFLEEVGHAGLGEVLQVPLLSTIAAAHRSRNPGAPLPRGRVALYEQFLADVATAREGADEVDKAFRARWERRGQGRLAEWMLINRDDLITHLAWLRTRGGTTLLDTAVAWLGTNLPADLTWPDGVRDELGQFLAQSGALVHDHGEVSFLHLSFAEFLAARDEAARIPADFPDLDDWADEIRAPSSRNRVLFTFALWARRPGHDVTVVVRHLLAGDLDHRIMAARLITSGVRLGDALEDAVIDRVVDFGQKSTPDERRGGEVLRELSQLKGNRRLAAALRRIAEATGLSASLRIGAASAYAQVASLSEGVALLKEMSQQVPPEGVLDCCRELAALDPADAGFRARLLSDLLASPTSSSWARLIAAEELSLLGRTEGLAEFACSFLAGTEENGGHLRQAGHLWFTLEGPSAAPRVAAAVAGRSNTREWAKAALAEVLFRFGLVDEALPLLEYTIQTSADSDSITEMVRAWLDQQGEKAANALVDLLRGYEVWNSDERPNIALDLVRAGYPRQAVEVVRFSLNDPDPDARHHLGLEAMALTRALGPQSAEEVLTWLDRHAATADSYAIAIRILTEADADASGLLPLSRRLLRHPGSGNDEFTSAARTILRFAPVDACAEVLAALRDRPYGGPSLRAALLPLLAEYGEATAVRTLSQELLADPGLVSHELRAVVAAWLALEGREAAALILDRVRASVRLTTQQSADLAKFLDSEDLAHVAVPLWCQMAATPGTSIETRWRAVQQLLAVDAVPQVEQCLRTALLAPHTPDEALLLSRLLAWVRPPTPGAG